MPFVLSLIRQKLLSTPMNRTEVLCFSKPIGSKEVLPRLKLEILSIYLFCISLAPFVHKSRLSVQPFLPAPLRTWGRVSRQYTQSNGDHFIAGHYSLASVLLPRSGEGKGSRRKRGIWEIVSICEFGHGNDGMNIILMIFMTIKPNLPLSTFL